MRKNQTFKFVLTGGSCGGKTSAIKMLKEKFENFNYNVFALGETSTELDFKGFTREKLGNEEYQRRILKRQIEKENIIMKYAKESKKNSIILCDRGTLDGNAYIADETFTKLLNEINYTREELAKRYDAVFHLTSVAVDMPEKYENTSNIMRRENILESQTIDKRLQKIWSINPNIFIIDNSTHLDMKIERTFLAMQYFIEKKRRKTTNKICDVNKNNCVLGD